MEIHFENGATYRAHDTTRSLLQIFFHQFEAKLASRCENEPIKKKATLMKLSRPKLL